MNRSIAMAKVYRTAQGRHLDMETIRLQNELVPALGNMRVNARGDQLGPGGKIIKTREMIMDEYYNTRPNNTTENIPQESNIPTRSPTKKRNDPLPTSSKKASTFTPDDAAPDPVNEENRNETVLKGGLASAIAKSKQSDKKVKRM